MKNKIQFLFTVILTVLIWSFIYYSYHPGLGYSLIVESLEAKSLVITHRLLDGHSFFPVSFAVGKPVFILPTILLVPLIYLQVPLAYSLPLVNILLIALAICVILNRQKYNLPVYILLSSIFLLSPWVLHISVSSTATALLIFLLSVFITTPNTFLKTLTFLLSILTSPLAWVIFPLALFHDFKSHWKTSFIMVSIGFIGIIVITFPNPKLFMSTFFPSLNPSTYTHQINVHRQADLVANVQPLGKIFNNKYVYITNALVTKTFSFLDWDRYIFIKSSGKSDGAYFD